MRQCAWPTCHRYQLDEYCFTHAMFYAGPKPPKEKKSIKHFSVKRAKQQNEYVKIVKEMLEANPYCELKVVGVCSGKAEGLHHMKKRGSNLLNKEFLKRACNNCNSWIEQNSKAALELGLSLSQHKQLKSLTNK